MRKLIHPNGKLLNIKNIKLTISIFPFFITILFVLLIGFEHTRNFALSLLRENCLIETLTFIFLLTGGLFGLALVYKQLKKGESLGIIFFYTIFSIGLLFVAMEEIAWGQFVIGFKTPDLFMKFNAQKEFTIHNLKGLHGKSEYFRIIFGFGGLVGNYLYHIQALKKIRVPKLLLTYFLCITIISSYDLYIDYFPVRIEIDKLLQRLSELIEMLIGLSGLLLIGYNWKECCIIKL